MRCRRIGVPRPETRPASLAGRVHENDHYVEGGQGTDWGRGPAWWKREVQDFFYQNARMYLEEYRADGLRFDVTTSHRKTLC